MASSQAESGNSAADGNMQPGIKGDFNSNDGDGNVMGNDNVVVKVHVDRRQGPQTGDQEPKEASPPYLMVPYSRNKAFTGRKSIIESMEAFCPSGCHNRVALQGLGGCGKTQLALEYTYRRAQESNCSVFWVQGNEELKFREGFQAIARHVRIPGANAENGEEEVLRRVKRWFEDRDGGWILVIDNADNDADFENNTSPIAKFVPQGGAGTVVFTTRSRLVAVRQCCQIFEVGKMTAGEAWALFSKRYGSWEDVEKSDEEKSVVAKVLQAVDHLPLAIIGSAAFMTENSTSPSEYWQIFQEKDQRIPLLLQQFSDIHRGAGMTESILETYLVTFRQIARQAPAAAQLLQLIAFIDRQNIPEELLTQCGPEGMDDPLQFRRTIGKLLGFSLVTKVKHEDATFYELHRLVQLSIRAYLSKEEQDIGRAAALQAISRLFPVYSYDRQFLCAAYMSHALVVTQGLTGPVAEDLSYRMGKHFLQMGSYSNAEIQILQCIEQRKADGGLSWNGANYTRTKLLGMVLRNQGKANEAAILFRQVMSDAEEACGSEDPEALRVCGHLALALQTQGKYEESEKMSRRALDGFERVLGPDDCDTLWAVHNLALVLRSQGRYDQSETMNRRALLGCEKSLGLDHPDTIWAVGSLGVVLQDQGKYEESKLMKRRALDWCEKSFGLDHPGTLMAVGNLASLLECQGRYDESELMNRRALEGYEKALGSDHPDTLWAVNSQAVILRGQGRYEESEAMSRRVLNGYEKSLGLEHPNTLMAIGNLASVLESQGSYEESEKMNRQALEGYEKALGPDHSDTLTAVSNLAAVLQQRGLYEESQTMNQRALEGYKKTVGLDHHNTLMVVNNLAVVLRNQGNYEESEKMNRRAVEGYTKAYGPDHPNTLIAVNDLAILLQEQGKYAEAEARFKYKEAEELLQRALEARENALGARHPEVYQTLECLALVRETQGQYPQAAEALALACQGWSQTRGEHHPTTLECIRRLALLRERESLGISLVEERVRGDTGDRGLFRALLGRILGYFR